MYPFIRFDTHKKDRAEMCEQCLASIDEDILKTKNRSRSTDRLGALSATAQHLTALSHATRWVGEEVLGKPLVSSQLDEKMLQDLASKAQEISLEMLLLARKVMEKAAHHHPPSEEAQEIEGEEEYTGRHQPPPTPITV